MKHRTQFILAGGLILLVIVSIARVAAEEKSHKSTTVSMRKMADSLHAIIVADQQVYSEKAAPHSGQTNGLLGHAQVLRLAAQRIQTAGAEFSYTLRSLTPVNPNQGPQTDAEKAGLEHTAKNPEDPYYSEELLGGRSYFTAVYPYRATLPACANCHNREPRSPRHDFKTNDVLGGIIIRIPLEF